MSDRVVYMNGEWVAEKDAKVSIYDLSVMQAAAAFEMCRSFNRVTFKLREHLERLEQSCRLLGIPMPMSWAKIAELCHECQYRNLPAMHPDDEHRLLIVVSPGAAPIYHQIDGVQKDSWLYIADFPLRYTTAGMGKYFTHGVHCVTSKIRQVPNSAIPSRAKHRSRLHFHLAQQQTQAGAWPILLDGDETVTEAPGANLIGVFLHTWQTPELLCFRENALRGISMQTVRELVPSKYGDYRFCCSHEDLCNADELWLTGTPFCMLPVVSLDGKPIGDGKVGPVFKETLAKWSQMVGVDIAKQIQTWDLPEKKSTAMTVEELHAL